MYKTLTILLFTIGSFWSCHMNHSPVSADIPVLKSQASASTQNKMIQASQDSISERQYTLQERELEYLMVIWPGEYDNIEQLDFDKFAGKSSAALGQHQRVHHHAEQLQASAMGEYVMYVEETLDDDPNGLMRQCIYVMSPSETSKSIDIQVYHFKALMPLLAAGKSIDHLNELTAASPALQQGCDMELQREGMAYRAVTVDKLCHEHATEVSLSVDYQFRIAVDEYWYEEIVYDRETQRRLPDDQQQSAHLLERVRCFVCMIDFPKSDGGRPVVTHHYIDMHDQGGSFEFDYLDGRHMVLGMRNTWSFGMQRETFVIFITEETQSGPTLIYSWGNPGADRIGFNPGWIRVQCDLDTPENRKMQQWLRPDS